MKRILKLLITGILLFCTAFSFFACGEEEKDTGNSSISYEEPANQIPYTQGDIYGRIDWEEEVSAIIRSKEELISAFGEIEISWENEPIWESYDESFFETKALVLDITWESGMEIRRELAYVCVENDTVILHINQYRQGNAVDCAMVVYPVFVEVNKADIENAEKIKRENHCFAL